MTLLHESFDIVQDGNIYWTEVSGQKITVSFYNQNGNSTTEELFDHQGEIQIRYKLMAGKPRQTRYLGAKIADKAREIYPKSKVTFAAI